MCACMHACMHVCGVCTDVCICVCMYVCMSVFVVSMCLRMNDPGSEGSDPQLTHVC